MSGPLTFLTFMQCHTENYKKEFKYLQIGFKTIAITQITDSK